MGDGQWATRVTDLPQPRYRADYSDPIAIRVGDDYYMVGSLRDVSGVSVLTRGIW